MTTYPPLPRRLQRARNEHHSAVRMLIDHGHRALIQHGQIVGVRFGRQDRPGRHRAAWRPLGHAARRVASWAPVTVVMLATIAALLACTPDAPPPPGWVVTDPGGMSSTVPPRVEVSQDSPSPTRVPCEIEPTICNPGGGR